MSAQDEILEKLARREQAFADEMAAHDAAVRRAAITEAVDRMTDDQLFKLWRDMEWIYDNTFSAWRGGFRDVLRRALTGEGA